MPTVINSRGTAINLLTTELNSMANNTNVLGSAITLGSDAGDLRGELELVVSFSVAPTANTSFALWLLREIDGTNYEDGGASVTPTRTPIAFFAVRAVTGAQRFVADVALPPGGFRALIRNDGTGQAIASSGNTLKLRPYTESW